MKKGVTLKGDPGSWGAGIPWTMIYTTSATCAVISANATITGFVIWNAKASTGIGIYVGNCSPVITKNTVLSSEAEGIYIIGASSPEISNNNIMRNKNVGICINGSAAKINILTNEIKNNTNGGILYSASASGSGSITNNTFISNGGVNQASIIIAGGNPKIRDNSITSSECDGILITGEGNADMGTSYDPGGNIMRFNLQNGLELKYTTAVKTVEAIGNYWRASTQEADTNGEYLTRHTVQGPTSEAAPANYKIDSADGFIKL